MRFYYNASHPLEILQSMTIKASWINGRSRGVSLSSKMIDSHGPFTFVFNDCSWFAQLRAVTYVKTGPIDELHKPEMFIDEYEWWSEKTIVLASGDIEKIIFRSGSPGAKIHPRIARRTAKRLATAYPNIYEEREG